VVDLNCYIKTVEIDKKEYTCIIPHKIKNLLNKLFRKNKISLKFLCFMLLQKKCKFFDKNEDNKNSLASDYVHSIEVPVNKFEKVEIYIYSLFVQNKNCFTFQNMYFE
jgi:hypothetical protein